MKIGVLIKQVPDTESRIFLKDDGSGIKDENVRFVINPFDEYAVEEALKLKEKAGGEVVIVSAGPARAADAMRQALAMGADRGVRIEIGGVDHDALALSAMLSEICKKESFDIIFAGKKSTDTDCGIVHIGVAKMLAWPHISPVEEFKISDDARMVTVRRPVGGGTKEIIECMLPAVVGCEKGLNNPRFPTLPNVMKAKAKPISVVAAADLAGEAESRVRIAKYEMMPERAACKVIRTDARAAAAELIKLLKEEAKVI